MLEESTELSNKTISANTGLILASINEKRIDPFSYEKATIVYPQAVKLQQLSKAMIKYIDALKDSLREAAGGKESVSIVNSFFTQNGRGDSLFQRLVKYKADMLDAARESDTDFDSNLTLTTAGFDNSGSKYFTKTFLYNIPVEAAMTTLSKFKTNVYTNEQKTIHWLHNRIQPRRICEFTAALIMQSSTIVQPGEYIEINSGVGNMITRPEPAFTINKKAVPLDGSGVATVKFRAPSKPGKYSIPVEVCYTDQNDGKEKIVSKTVYYTVAGKAGTVQ